MSRYVDVEYFRDLFNDKYLETVKLISSGETYLDNLAEGFTEASQIIGSLPPADVEEIRHAKWDDSGDEVHYCSNCNMDALFIGFVQILTDYCPHCGAKMA